MEHLTPEVIAEVGRVLVEWGFWIAVYGVATMVIGATLMLLFGKQITVAFKYVIENLG